MVVSELDATYAQGGSLIERALCDSLQELGRQEIEIIPVVLAGNDVKDIRRKPPITNRRYPADDDEKGARGGAR